MWKAGGEGNDAATSTAKDVSGNIYTTGYFSSVSTFGNTTYNTSGQSDIFITKHDALGNMVWATKAGGLLHDKAFSIVCDDFGNSYITGIYRGTATFGSTTINSVNNTQDIFIAKYDVQGNLAWVKSAGGNETDISSSITVDNYGNAYITGQFKGSAAFDNQTLTSTLDTAGNPTYDIFIAKYNMLGNLAWLKQGAAHYEDRGLSIAYDGHDYLYTTGQFSDTLNFSDTYVNNSYNSGYLLKLDLNGNEIWFKRFTAGVVVCNDVSANYPDQIYVTGDFSGTLMVSGPPYESTNSAYSKKIFIALFNAAGQLAWLENDGSDNDVSARSVSTDAAGNAYITGNFKCTFNEYSELYGTGIFNSVGLNDVFISKYNNAGQREWERQFGGNGEDRAWGIESSSVNNPIICGSFSHYFNVPSTNAFGLNSVSTHTSDGNAPSMDYCGDNNYGNFTSVISTGQSDILLCKPVDLSRAPYDFYERNGSQCLRDFIPAGIVGPDSITACDSVFIFTRTYTGTLETIGPDFIYNWSNGNNSDGFMVMQTGLYTVNMSHNDGCRSYTDSIYVNIVTTPPTPNIVSDYGIIIQSYPLLPCKNKLIIMAGDTAHFSVSNIPTMPGYEYYWETPTGIVYDSVIAVFSGGTYSFRIFAAGSQQCDAENCVEVFIFTEAHGGQCQGINPELHLIDSIFDVTDTVRVCFEGHFGIHLTDSALLPLYLPVFGQWTFTGGMDYISNISITFLDHTMYFEGLTSGMCTVTLTLLYPPDNTPFYTISRTFYLDITTVTATPPVISGPPYLCPGDTVLVTIQHQGTLTVSGVTPVYASPGNDTLLLNFPGVVGASVTVSDSALGCSDNASDHYELVLKPPPIITMNPANGLICPYDSVLLTVPQALSYEWRGPDGDVISNTQSAYASNPGLYHCIIIDLEGCMMISEPVEINQYATPFIDSDGANALCAGENVTIHVTTLEGSVITWAPPLSGSGTEVIVNQPGIYSCSVSLCGITTQLSVEIVMASVVPVITVFGNDSICEGQSTLLSTLPGMSYYEWSNGEEGVNTLEIDEPGTYTVTVTDPNGCNFTSAPIEIYAAGAPPATPITSDTTICAGETATVNALSDWTVYWFADPNAPIPFASGEQVISDTLFETITFFAASFDSTCYSDRVPVNINVSLASLPPVISGDSLLCTGDTLNLISENYLNVIYSWTGPGSFSSSENEIIITPVGSQNQGMYSLSLSDGICNSPITSINVLVGSPPPALITVSNSLPICAGDSVLLSANEGYPGYTWIDNISGADTLWVFSDGNYWVEVADSAGCSAISDTVEITFSPLPEIAVPSDTIACPFENIQLTATSGGMIYWYSDSISTTPVDSGQTVTINLSLNDTVIYAVAYDSQCFSNMMSTVINIHEFSSIPEISGDSVFCEGQDILLQTPLIENLNYLWTGANGDTLSTTNELSLTQISINSEGLYHLSVTDGICDVVADSITILVHPLPTATVIPNGPIEFCEDSTVMLISPLGYWGYEWLPAHINDNILTVNQTGEYSIIVTDTNGCADTSDVIEVTVFPLPEDPSAIDTMVCSDVPFNLFIPGSGILMWYDDNFSFLFNGHSYSSQGINDSILLYIQMTDTNGCHSSFSPVSININPLPASFEITGDDSVCVNTTATFSADEFIGATYTWTTPSETVQGNNIFTISPTTLNDSGYYELNIDYEGCSGSSLPTHLTVIDRWQAPQILGPETVCVGENAYWGTNITPGAVYYWIDPYNNIITGNSIQFVPVQPGDHGPYYLLFNKLGCPSDTGAKTLTVGYIPLPNAGNDTISCIDNPVLLSLDSTYSDAMWNNYSNTPTIEANDSGWYVVVVTNGYGCSNYDSIYVTLVECNISVPNIITPNNDGINDSFTVDDTYMESILVIIYDRWGKMVYKWSNKSSSWNGKNIFTGLPVSDGTYFYVIEGVRIDKTFSKQAGFIQVIH